LCFESESKLSQIEGSVIAHCSSLKSIVIPSAVEVLDKDWALETSLSRVTFESGLLLQRGIDAIKPIPACQIEIPARDVSLDFPGYFVVSCSDDPSMARLMRRRADNGQDQSLNEEDDMNNQTMREAEAEEGEGEEEEEKEEERGEEEEERWEEQEEREEGEEEDYFFGGFEQEEEEDDDEYDNGCAMAA
jgi:hypothetical protein